MERTRRPILKVIGMAGKARSGKSTASRTISDICRTRELSVISVAFADELRKELAAVLDTPRTTVLKMRPGNGVEKFLETDEFKDGVLTPKNLMDTHEVRDFKTTLEDKGITLPAKFTGRQLLQLWGTEFRQTYSPHYWVDKLHQRVHGLLDRRDAVIVLSDVRFLHEVAYVLSLGQEISRTKGYVAVPPSMLGVVRLDQVDHSKADAGVAHSSEKALPRWVFTGWLPNAGTERDFSEVVRDYTFSKVIPEFIL